MRNKTLFVAFMIAMVALTQIQISPVFANEKEETPLSPVPQLPLILEWL